MYLYNSDSSYNGIYGNNYIPKDKLIELIRDKYEINDEVINELVSIYDSRKTEKFTIVLLMVPNGSPRPRNGNGHFYIEGAAQLKRILALTIRLQDTIHDIEYVKYDFYLPTPITKLNPHDILLAEMGKIRPDCKPDFDNLPKGYTDAIVGTVLKDDKYISSAYIEKYYSIKPRIEIEISHYI